MITLTAQAVYEVVKQTAIAEGEANRQAKTVQQNQAIQAEANRQAETTQRELDRFEENRRVAFGISMNTEYNNLSKEQQDAIRETIKTGKF